MRMRMLVRHFLSYSLELCSLFFRGSVVESFDKYYTHLVATSPATRAKGVLFNETYTLGEHSDSKT